MKVSDFLNLSDVFKDVTKNLSFLSNIHTVTTTHHVPNSALVLERTKYLCNMRIMQICTVSLKSVAQKYYGAINAGDL